MAEEYRKESLFEEDTSKDRKSEKKYQRSEKRYHKAQKITDQARRRIPHKNRLVIERHFDPETGKVTHKLTTDQILKKRKRKTTLQKAVQRSLMEGRFYVHGKISENEQDNTGLEAAHKTEEAVEDIVRFGKLYRRDKNARRRRKYEKAKRYEFQAGREFAYRKFLEENPEIQKKLLQKRLQKERIKKEYARQFRKRVKEAEKGAAVFRETEKQTVLIASKIIEVIREHAVGFGIATFMGLFFMLITTMISSCGAMLGSGGSEFMAGAYQSLPADIDACEDSFKLKEMYLQNDIDNTETNYPNYDEYVYDLGHIGHNPFTLIGYLSAVMQIFTASGAESEVQSLFDEMYELTFTPSEETRTRTVTVTTPGDMPGEDIITEEEEEYTVTIMTVMLLVKPLEDIVNERLTGNDEAISLYETYGLTHGLLQRFWSPVNVDWMSRISCYYGYRVHPITGDNQFHRGLDIALPEGTELFAAMDGTVTTATYDDSYGNYVVITDENGYQIKYAHMQSLGVTEGQTVTHGDMIGYSGNTGGSTGPHLHLECLVNGDYYNPIFYFLNG